MTGAKTYSFEPFRVARGRRATLTIKGDDVSGLNLAVLFRGRDRHFSARIRHSNGAATIEFDVPENAIQGLYSVVLYGVLRSKAVARNAVMVLDPQNHNGSFLEIEHYYKTWRYVLDSDGIPMKDMGYDVGFVRHPVVATYYAQTYRGQVNDPQIGRAAREGFHRLVHWLEMQLSDAPNQSLLVRHAFPLISLNFKPGWISGLTQGRVAEVFIEAWKLSKDERYLSIAERLCRIMAVPVQDGGLLASDSYGHVAIEEYSTQPAHWALNGIGSAINSLEYISNFVPVPWASQLIADVCRGMNAKIDLFDCPDYPGSRVQLAMMYSLNLRLAPSGALDKLKQTGFQVQSAKLRPWLSDPLQLELADGASEGATTFSFEAILDDNRDPLDGSVEPRTEIEFSIITKVPGTVNLTLTHNGEKISLGEANVRAGSQIVSFSFDLSQCLPMGVGRVARWNETYHETNLAWIWQLSAYGRETRCAFVGRRWLFSFLTGKGRLPLSGSTFDTSKLLERRAYKSKLIDANQAEERELPAVRAARADIAAIDQILALQTRNTAFSISHTTPAIVSPTKGARLSIFGLGFDGTEQVSLIGGNDESPVGLPADVVSGDEIAVHLDPACVTSGEQIRLAVARPSGGYEVVSIAVGQPGSQKMQGKLGAAL